MQIHLPFLCALLSFVTFIFLNHICAGLILKEQFNKYLSIKYKTGTRRQSAYLSKKTGNSGNQHVMSCVPNYLLAMNGDFMKSPLVAWKINRMTRLQYSLLCFQSVLS